MKDVVGDLTWPEPRSLRNNRQPTRDDDTDCYTIGFFADGLLERWHPFGSSFVTTLYRLFFSPFFWVSFLQSVFGRDQPGRFVSIIWLQGDGVLLSIL